MWTRLTLVAACLIPWNAALACESVDGRLAPHDLVTLKPFVGEELRQTLTLISRRVTRRERDWVRVQPAKVDYELPTGTTVVAVHSGRVEVAQTPYGNSIVIDHGAGLKTRYSPLDSLEVRAGNCVSAGSILGRLGSREADNNPTLHFEITDNGQFIDLLQLPRQQ